MTSLYGFLYLNKHPSQDIFVPSFLLQYHRNHDMLFVLLRFADLAPLSAIISPILMIDCALFRIDSFGFFTLTISPVLFVPQESITTQIPLENAF